MYLQMCDYKLTVWFQFKNLNFLEGFILISITTFFVVKISKLFYTGNTKAYGARIIAIRNIAAHISVSMLLKTQMYGRRHTGTTKGLRE